MQAQLIDNIDIKATLGEAVLWDWRRGEVLWTDIQECHFYRYVLATKQLHRRDLAERLTAFGLSAHPDWLIAAFESGFAWFNSASGAVQWIERPEAGETGRRFNDGRVAPCGRFWCGTMVEDSALAGETKGGLYCCDRHGAVSQAFGDVSISNALAWSPDGALMYFADSPKRTIWVFDYDMEKGTLANKRCFAQTPESIYPDGATVDAEGYLWNAQWGGGRVARYAPDGTLSDILTIPTTQPSCVAFGGADMNILFVTTARENMSSDMLANELTAGDLFIYQTQYKGLPSDLYQNPHIDKHSPTSVEKLT